MANNAWVFVASRKNWQDVVESKSFCLERSPNKLKLAVVGDPCVAYIKGESIFAGLGEIIKSYYYEEATIRKDPLSPHRVGIELDLDFSHTIDIRSLIDKLDFMKNQASWQVFLKSGVVRVPVSDFEMVRTAMERQEVGNTKGIIVGTN